MKIKDLFSLALRNLWRRKVRTILTIMGVVIGSTSIIIMLSLGEAQNKQIDKMIKENDLLKSIEVSPEKYFDPRYDTGREPTSGIITSSVIKAIKDLDHVTGVIYSEQPTFSSGIKFKKYMLGGEVIGLSKETFDTVGINLVEGRMPNPDSKDLEIIVNQDSFIHMLYQPNSRDYNQEAKLDKILGLKGQLTLGGNGYFENDKNPLSEMLGEGGEEQKNNKKEKVTVKVVGTYSSNNYNRYSYSVLTREETILKLNDRNDKLTLSPKEYNKKRKSSKRYYNDLTVKVDDMANIDSVTKQIEDMSLMAHSNKEMIENMKKANATGQAILAGIGSISFIVAAIGITNTMVMSIYERTKEIGVMKVIGASINDIRWLFLLESGMIGLIGGIIGVLFSLGISLLLNSVLAPALMNEFGFGMMDGEIPVISEVSPQLIIIALAFSFIIGLATGYFPARRATKLSPIEALRTE